MSGYGMSVVGARTDIVYAVAHSAAGMNGTLGNHVREIAVSFA
jgi:hypothetical protein